ncbi:bacteriohemerythrin [Dechloromonas sp. HYN0024]|uniref:bacteriohemerythrin n=1 Tax=Dechloromonas sp. HYN0024 TaxID=2231055 RepID=UPI000E43F208|nr:bacteriohemerythrin [Dechloromonas sp. HYN0024]AXS79662.1 EAL domain-containing protein [Dechloromonas sp. HYN0024]
MFGEVNQGKADQGLEEFEIFPWNKNLETGIQTIDNQHRQLVALINRLAAHVADKASELTLNEVFDHLAAYVNYHFQTEEQIWHSFIAGDPSFSAHQEVHNGFVEKVTAWRNNRSNLANHDEVIGDLLGFLTHWLAYHILDSDRRMAWVVHALQSGLDIEAAKKKADLEMSGAMKVLIDTVLAMYDSLSARTLDLLRERTERRRAEEALQASEDRWKFVLDGAGDGVWDWDIVNDEIFRSTQSSTILDFLNVGVDGESGKIHPDDIGRVRVALKDHLEGRSASFVNEHRVVHPNGLWSWVLTRGKVTARDASGLALRMIGTHSDVTERELAMIFFQNTNEGMVVVDQNERIIAINPAFQRLSGFGSEELLGHSMSDLWKEDSLGELPGVLSGRLAVSGAWSGEIWMARSNGESAPVYLELNTVSNPDGSPNYRICLVGDLSERKLRDQTIWRQTNFDALTDLPNRYMMIDRLTQHLTSSFLDTNHKVALLIFDLERLRDVNSVFGRKGGDGLIRQMVERLKSCLGNNGVLGRLGGGEFVIILSGISDLQQIDRCTEALLEQFESPFVINNENVFATGSIGITLAPDDGDDSETLFHNAEQAMYQAKNLGRNRHAYYAAFMQQGAQIRTRMANELRQALTTGQLAVHYQPIVDLHSRQIVKAEALLRWQHPVHGAISPATFIPIAEECGLIVEIGNWVFREAASKAAIWRQTVPNFQIGINKSPIQFKDECDQADADPHGWFTFLAELGIPGETVAIEITEGTLMGDQPKVLDRMLEMRRRGMSISLDDFGTGYSSLSYLQRFPIDFIKIDRSFVMHLTAGSSQFALCEAMIVMAHKLGIQVVAEGIETEEQNRLIADAGCDYGQGYLYSKAVDWETFSFLLSDGPLE